MKNAKIFPDTLKPSKASCPGRMMNRTFQPLCSSHTETPCNNEDSKQDTGSTTTLPPQTAEDFDILAMDLNISFPSSLQPESLLMTPLWRPLTSQQSKTIQMPHPLAKTRTATSTQQSRNPSTTPTRRTPGLPEKWNYSSSPTRTSQLHTTH